MLIAPSPSGEGWGEGSNLYATPYFCPYIPHPCLLPSSGTEVPREKGSLLLYYINKPKLFM